MKNQLSKEERYAIQSDMTTSVRHHLTVYQIRSANRQQMEFRVYCRTKQGSKIHFTALTAMEVWQVYDRLSKQHPELKGIIVDVREFWDTSRALLIDSEVHSEWTEFTLTF